MLAPLYFEFAGKKNKSMLRGRVFVLPLLDLVEVLQEGDGDEDNDGLLAVADLDLIAEVDVRISVRPECARTQIAKIQCALRSRRRGIPLPVIVSTCVIFHFPFSVFHPGVLCGTQKS